MDRLEKTRLYLQEEKQCQGLALQQVLDKIIKYEDIFEDFYHWLETREYDHEGVVIVEGYNAQSLVDLAPMLDGVGACNFLVDLREQPEEALRKIKEGFRVL